MLALAAIAGYRPLTDVTQHNRLDLDVQAFDGYVDNADWAGALDIYTNGRNSQKSSGLRKLKAFSVDADTLMSSHPLYPVYKAYWGSATYADDVVVAALAGTGEFAGVADVARGEIATKTIQYQSVWMYTIREMDDAVDDCRAGATHRNDAGVQAMDEAAAFYTGSLEGPVGTGNGFMLYAGAHKRCAQFGTCNPSTGRARVNDNVLGLMAQAQALLNVSACDAAFEAKNKIVTQMTIPLIQGGLRYVVRGDPNAGFTSTSNFAKERAEGWAFWMGVLPQIDKCSKTAAATIRRNIHFKASPFLADGPTAVMDALGSVLPCMGISCNDVGNLTESGVVKYRMCDYVKAPAPTGSTSGAASHDVVVVAVAWVGAVVAALMM